MDQVDRDRQHRMGLLARAPAARVAELLGETGLAKDAQFLRPPEIGSVMVQGRAGVTGSAFNLGEVTVTRCTLRLDCGAVGHGHVQGRRKDDAKAAAMVDALMQTETSAKIQSAVLDPLQVEEDARRGVRAAKAAATKVDFFTMVRGED